MSEIDSPDNFELEPLTSGPAYIKPRLKGLIEQAIKAKAQSDALNEACKLVAEKAEVNPSALLAYVKAQAADEPTAAVEKKSTQASDFCMLADELGGVGGVGGVGPV